MLTQFVDQNREEIILRCRARVAVRSVPPPTPAEVEYGVPRFLDQLVQALQRPLPADGEISRSAALHARDLQLQGFTVSQIVYDYGDVCQVITDLAVETNAPISIEEFRTLNRCLDDAIASAMTEYGRERNQAIFDAKSAQDVERSEFLAHEIRNLVNTASIAFEVLKAGNVGVSGSTGAVLQRSLAGLTDLITRSIAEVRLRHQIRHHSHIDVAAFISELTPAAELEAEARGLTLAVVPGAAGVAVEADRQILTAVVANLLQNAFKFTRPKTTVKLSVKSVDDRVHIEVEDECGGLPGGNISDLFQPFEQRSSDRTGLGLGLAISRWGAEANNGRIYTRNLPDRGCVFIVDLPQVPKPLTAAG